MKLLKYYMISVLFVLSCGDDDRTVEYKIEGSGSFGLQIIYQDNASRLIENDPKLPWTKSIQFNTGKKAVLHATCTNPEEVLNDTKSLCQIKRGSIVIDGTVIREDHEYIGGMPELKLEATVR